MTITETPTTPRAEPPDSHPLLGAAAFVAMAIALVVLVAAVVAVGVAALLRDDPSSDTTSTATTVNVTLTEFAIGGDLTAPSGQVTLDVSNDGSAVHNLVVRGTDLATADLAAGASAQLALGELPPGSYELLCTIPGHEAAGMTADLVITEPGTDAGADTDAAAPGDHDAMGHDAVDGDAADAVMIESMLAFPAETEGVGNVPLEPEILPDGTKQFELTAAITPWEVAPGEVVDAWTYNGVVPAPQIKVDVGDRVRVIVNNETPMGTDVHWHGVTTPNDQDGVSPYTQEVISTGETFTYEFVTERPAIGMYHAHLHGQVSVVNGMFGSFIVGDNPIPRGDTVSGVTIPEDLVPAAELPMVLNDAGVIGLTLNGKSFPATAPVVVDEGDWVSVHYYNEGLTAHPMHLHQFPQLVYARDGIPLDEPYWADTINIAPGERYSVLFRADEPGTWAWHCHILTHAERDTGMFGMVTAVVVNEAA